MRDRFQQHTSPTKSCALRNNEIYAADHRCNAMFGWLCEIAANSDEDGAFLEPSVTCTSPANASTDAFRGAFEPSVQ